MEPVDKRTTRKHNNKNQTTNINYRKNVMSILRKNNKIKLASDEA